MKTMNEIKEMLKTSLHFLLMFGIVASLSSCGPEGREAAYEEEDLTVVDKNRDDVVDTDVVDTYGAGEEWMEERSELTKNYHETTSRIDNKIVEWEKDLETMETEAKVEMQVDLDELKMKRKNLDTELEKMENTSQEGWRESKSGASKAVDELDKSFEEVEAKFDTYDKERK